VESEQFKRPSPARFGTTTGLMTKSVPPWTKSSPFQLIARKQGGRGARQAKAQKFHNLLLLIFIKK
jgi:hypothetical protein